MKAEEATTSGYATVSDHSQKNRVEMSCDAIETADHAAISILLVPSMKGKMECCEGDTL